MNFVLFADNTTTTTGDGAFDGVNDFFHSDTWSVIWKLGVLFVIVFWLASAYWVYKDARRRIDDPWLVAMATLLGLVPPFIGPLVYLFFRPPEYLEDIRERELEIRAMERRLGADQVCPYCRNPADPSFLSCPHCGTKLKNACRRCKSPLDPEWRLCPYCETAVAGGSTPRTRDVDVVSGRTTTDAPL